MKRKLTKIQNDLFSFIKDYINEKEQSPTLVELCDSFKKTTRTIAQHLDALQSKGYIHREKGKHRGIVILVDEEGSSMERVPVKSFIGCDNACVYGTDIIDDYVLVSKEVIKEYGSLEAGIAVGFSMDEIAQPGDTFLIKPIQGISNLTGGEIVISKIDGNVLAKQISINEKTITLSPMSSDCEYKPLVFNKNDGSLEVIGIVIDILKKPKINNIKEEEIVPEEGYEKYFEHLN